MNIEFVVPQGMARPASNYSHAAIVSGGRLVLLSGQVGAGADGAVPEDFAEQCRLAWRNVETALKAAGADLSSIARVNAFIVRRADTATFREIRDATLPHSPASTVVIAELLDPRWLVEIEVTAVV